MPWRSASPVAARQVWDSFSIAIGGNTTASNTESLALGANLNSSGAFATGGRQ